MKKQIVYDFTKLEETLASLSNYLDINESDIRRYIYINKDTYDTEEFLEKFFISDEKLLASDLKIASLHVTTNNDNFDSIKKYGIVNLQQAVTLDTSLRKFLLEQGVAIDVKKKEVTFNGKSYKIHKDHKGIVDRKKDFISYKLYEDYQVNSFFAYDNVLNYGVSKTPEFFHNLCELLNDNTIGYNWIKHNNNCYVIKFAVPLSNIANFTFDITQQDEESNKLETEINKRKWVIEQSLTQLNDGIFYSSNRDCYCYLKSDVSVPYSDIIKIYTPDEYLKEYRIED